MDRWQLARWIRRNSIAVLAAGIAACGGSGPGPGANTTAAAAGCIPRDTATLDACGTVVLALTDVEGDFTSYTLDVVSVTLERATGGAVELLPQATRVDFAQLTDLSELVSSARVVPGDYVAGRIRLDYSDAEIFVEADGTIVAAEVHDRNGRLLTADTPDSIVDVDIRLPASGHLFVRRGLSSLLSIDFDLSASHLVDTSVDPVVAIAEPYLLAEVRPVDEKSLRVRGTLVDVDPDAMTYDIRLRPGYHRDGDFGLIAVHTNADTGFLIDDVAYTGADGLTALGGMPEGTLTVAFGTLNLSDRQFTAQVVHAGDSVEGSRYSAVLGNIVARSGNRLEIRGGIAIRRDRRAHFQRTILADIGPDTRVSKEGAMDQALDTSALSVGQRVLIFGEFAAATTDSPDPFGPDIALVLDATRGRARLQVTRLTGSLNAAMPGEIEVRLRAIDRLGIDMFDFAGTGPTAELDADPARYQVDIATLPIDALQTDRPIRVYGFVAPFAAAPPDFTGRVLVGPRDLPATLGIGWGITGTSAPFSLMGSDSLVLDLANPAIGTRHHLLIGYELVDLFDLPASPALVEGALPRVYGIQEPGHVELFVDFADFVDELALRLSSADRARSLAAYGSYDVPDNTVTARKIVVHMLPGDSL